jgi:hypothetical protein
VSTFLVADRVVGGIVDSNEVWCFDEVAGLEETVVLGLIVSVRVLM